MAKTTTLSKMNDVEKKLEVVISKLEYVHSDIQGLKSEVRENTGFRLSVKGFIAAVASVAGVLGALVVTFINKLFNG